MGVTAQRGQSVTVEQLCRLSGAAPEVEERLRAVAAMMKFLDLKTPRAR